MMLPVPRNDRLSKGKSWLSMGGVGIALLLSVALLRPLYASEISPEMQSMLGQLTAHLQSNYGEDLRAGSCRADARIKASTIYQSATADFLFQRVVVDSLHAAAIQGIKATFPGSPYLLKAGLDTYSLYKCYVDAYGDRNTFGRCFAKVILDRIADEGVDSLMGLESEYLPDMLKNFINDSNPLKPEVTDFYLGAWDVISGAGSAYHGKSEVWTASVGRGGFAAKLLGNLNPFGKAGCEIADIRAEWNRQSRKDARGGQLRVLITFAECSCSRATDAESGSYLAVIPVKYVPHGNSQPGFELDLNRISETVRASCCSGREERTRFCEERNPNWMTLGGCQNQCSGTCEYAGRSGPGKDEGLRCYRCKAEGKKEPPPEDTGTVYTPPEPKLTGCQPCRHIEDAIKTVQDEIAKANQALQAALQKLSQQKVSRERLQGEIARLEGMLAAQQGIGASSYDPDTDTTTTSVDRGDGSVEITVRRGRGEGGEILNRRVRQRQSTAGIKAALDAKKAELEILLQEIAATEKEIADIEGRIVALRRKLQELQQNLARCTVAMCTEVDEPCEFGRAEDGSCLEPKDEVCGSGGEEIPEVCEEADDIWIGVLLVSPRDGNDPFDPEDPLQTGIQYDGGNVGGAGCFDFNRITTPPGYFITTSPAGSLSSCGTESTYVSFNGSILTFSYFYGNDPTTFAASCTSALSQSSNLTILGQPGHSCEVQPGDADTFTVVCTNTNTNNQCGDVWTRQ